MRLFDPGFSRSDYLDLIQAFLGFYRPLEACLGRFTGFPELIPDHARRARSAWLEADLVALGMDAAGIAALPVCPRLPAVDCLPAALGCMYVLEGAALGGQLIAGRMRLAFGFEADSGIRFFLGNGAATRAHWQSFGAALPALLGEAPAQAAAIRAARDTFLRLEAWLESRGLLREDTAHGK